MNKKKLVPNKLQEAVCEQAHKGNGVTTIAKKYNLSNQQVRTILKNYYFIIYGVPSKSFHQQRDEKAKRIYKAFKNIYKPFVYSSSEICEKISLALSEEDQQSVTCTVAELDYMLLKYNIKNSRLKISEKQKTMPAIPIDEYNYYKSLAESQGKSFRQYMREALSKQAIEHEGDF